MWNFTRSFDNRLDSLFGRYRLNGTRNGRKMWKHENRQNYIYFWDWGVNSGAEWMVGHSPDSSVRGIRSTNLERSGAFSVCVMDAHLQGDGGWQMWTGHVFVSDDSFKMSCIQEDQII